MLIFQPWKYTTMYTIYAKEIVPISLETCWHFFSSAKNLKILTPAHLSFSQADVDEEKPLYAGKIIIHRIKPLFNIPIEWITEITHLHEKSYFIDEQRFGPFKFWHHEHRFVECAQGVEIIDQVHYQLPLGIFGTLVHHMIVKRDLKTIFDYRAQKIREIFCGT